MMRGVCQSDKFLECSHSIFNTPFFKFKCFFTFELWPTIVLIFV